MTQVVLLTAVDSSVLLDILTDDPTHRAASLAALRKARSAGALIACPIVWAEMCGFFTDLEPMRQSFADAEIRFDPFDRECAEIAGTYWQDYRRHGGARSRLIADFLIGAHAQVRGGRLLTRDRGSFRRYFSAVQVIAAE